MQVDVDHLIQIIINEFFFINLLIKLIYVQFLLSMNSTQKSLSLLTIYWLLKLFYSVSSTTVSSMITISFVRSFVRSRER